MLCRCLLRLVGVVDDDVAAPKRNGCKDRHAPRIKKLKENNVRKGFFERDQYEAVRRHLPEYARPVVTFAYITGWRVRSEVLPLQWRQVDFKAGTIRLEPGTTKNDDGRMFVMTPELRATLEAQRAETDVLQRRTGNHPVALPSAREAAQEFREGVADCLPRSRHPRTHSSRLPQDGSQESRTSRRASLGGDEDSRAPDGEHLPTIRYR